MRYRCDTGEDLVEGRVCSRRGGQAAQLGEEERETNCVAMV